MKKLDTIAQYYKAMADVNRLRILKLLSDQEFLCVKAITNKLDITQSAVSQHLRILRQAGLVTNERKAFHMHYTLNKKALSNYKNQIATTLSDDFIKQG